ncbi:MAG: type II toxin-antitoxin system VapC family toxin [Gemmatimonadota bacterium]
MRFWDTSALVPLLLEQEASATVRKLLDEDRAMAAWWGTPVECASAAARLRREERLSVTEEQEVLRLLRTLRTSWLEILPSSEVRDEAMRLLRVHSLTAADALQLAAAAVLAGGDRSEVALVTFDERLALAARLEGFEVLPGS